MKKEAFASPYRTLKLEYNKSTTFKGVDVLHFLLPYSEFASAKDNPDNAGYCTPDTNNCPPSGTINMSAVSYSELGLKTDLFYIFVSDVLISPSTGISQSVEASHGGYEFFFI